MTEIDVIVYFFTGLFFVFLIGGIGCVLATIIGCICGATSAIPFKINKDD